MSHLKPGTQVVIVAGCPENIGIILEDLGGVYQTIRMSWHPGIGQALRAV